MNEIQHLIDGRSVASTSGNVGPVFDPATGQQTGTVALASVAEVVRGRAPAPPGAAPNEAQPVSWS